MPADIKQEPSAQVPNEATQNELVSKAELIELRACKRKLEEMEPQFQANKRRLEEQDLKMQNDAKKLEQFKLLKELVATDVKFKPKRAKISLKLADFAKIYEKFWLYSEPVNVAGFQWKLIAHAGQSKEEENAGWMGLSLRANPPFQYKGPFEIGIDFSFHLCNTFSSKDIHMEWKDQKITRVIHSFGGAGLQKFKLLDQNNGFLQNDGSILVEADFTVKSTTFDHFLVDADQQDNSNGNEESVGEE